MEMAYRERWRAEIAALQNILSGFDLKEECKWGRPCYTVDGRNVAIIQGFRDYCALGFFQGALLKDPKKLLVQLGQVQAARVMKFTSAREIEAKAATIRAYVREAVAAAKAFEGRDEAARIAGAPTSCRRSSVRISSVFQKSPKANRRCHRIVLILEVARV